MDERRVGSYQRLAARACWAFEYKTMKDKPEPISVTPSWGNDKWSDPDSTMSEITPSISDTPETDEAMIRQAIVPGEPGRDAEYMDVVPLATALMLEREKNEAQALATRYRTALESIVAVAMESPDHLLMHVIASDSPIRAVFLETGKPNAEVSDGGTPFTPPSCSLPNYDETPNQNK